MTTIAYKDGVLAADRSVWQDDTYVGERSKITRVHTGGLAGAAGTASFVSAFLQWAGGVREDCPPRGEGDVGFVVNHDTMLQYDEAGEYIAHAPYFAWGSGADVALGAMHAGVSATDAVKAACFLTAHTRQPIDVLEADWSR